VIVQRVIMMPRRERLLPVPSAFSGIMFQGASAEAEVSFFILEECYVG